MSWWISISDPKTGEGLQVPLHNEGGTIVLGGSSMADLNVTYNYDEHFRRVLDLEDGFWSLNGMTCEEAFPILVSGIAKLKSDEDQDYWAPTEGNAKRALKTIAMWCGFAIANELGSAKLDVR